MSKTKKRKQIMTLDYLSPPITGVLKYGKFYRLRESAYLWKNDRSSPMNMPLGKDRPQSMVTPGVIVMVSKKGRYRFVQIMIGEQIGYIWCPTNKGLAEMFEAVTDEEIDQTMMMVDNDQVRE